MTEAVVGVVVAVVVVVVAEAALEVRIIALHHPGLPLRSHAFIES